MQNNFLLTILIPTYNRSPYICRLLQSFGDSVIYKDLSQEIEIVIADNCSNDEKVGDINGLCQLLSNCKLINHQDHVPTAEENVFRSFKDCSGEYIWVLGDDDIPVFENLPMIIAELKSGNHDFLIFNFPIIGGDAAITTLGAFKIHGQQFTDDIVNIAMHNGFWFVLAAMSSQILRASYVKNYNFAEVLEEGVIYSHVTSYLDCFSGKKTTCFNYPLVWYKVVDRDITHWQKAAKKMNVFDEYFWTLGFIKQLKFLARKGVIDQKSLFSVLDQNDYNKFRLINVVHEKFYNQILLGIKNNDARQILKRDEFYEIFDFLLASSIYLRELLWDIEKIYKEFLEEKKRPTIELRSQISEKFKHINADLLYGFFVHRYEDYLIYKIFNTYYAIQSDNIEYLKEELRYVNSKPSKGILYIGDNMKDIILLIEKEVNSSGDKERDYFKKSYDDLKKVCESHKNTITEKDLLLQTYKASMRERDQIAHQKILPSRFKNNIKKIYPKFQNKIRRILGVTGS